jgi:hypothetical protein
MKKLLALSMGIIALSACGTRTVVVEQVIATTTTVYEPLQPSNGENIYIRNIVDQYPGLLNKFGKPWLIDFAKTVCTEIDNGMTINDLLDMSRTADADAETVGYLTGEAIRNFCPENQWFIDAALSGNI